MIKNAGKLIIEESEWFDKEIEKMTLLHQRVHIPINKSARDYFAILKKLQEPCIERKNALYDFVNSFQDPLLKTIATRYMIEGETSQTIAADLFYSECYLRVLYEKRIKIHIPDCIKIEFE